jgi:hypothetical protein
MKNIMVLVRKTKAKKKPLKEKFLSIMPQRKRKRIGELRDSGSSDSRRGLSERTVTQSAMGERPERKKRREN